MRLSKDLTTGSIPSHLVKLALPLLGTSFIQLLYNFTDMAWLGRLGSESVAASSVASVFLWLAASIALTNKVGAEVSVAYEIGNRENKNAASYASHALTLALLFGLLVSIVYITLGDSLIQLFYVLKPDLHATAVQYLRVVSLGLPFVHIASATTGIYNATGHSPIPFSISSIGLLINMVLDPLFIYIFHLGVMGAAIATVMAQCAVAILFLKQLHKDRLLGGVCFLRKVQMHQTKTLLKIGGPVALMNSLMALINMTLGHFASATAGHLGVTTLSVGGQLEGLCWNTGQGLSTALSAFVSQNFGAQNYHRIRRGLFFTLKVCFIIGSGGFMLYLFWGDHLFRLIIPEAAAVSSGEKYLRINSVSQLFMMVELAFQGYFYGLKKSWVPTIISISGNLIRLPLAFFILPIFKDITILWWIICITAILKGVFILFYYLQKRKTLTPV